MIDRYRGCTIEIHTNEGGTIFYDVTQRNEGIDTALLSGCTRTENETESMVLARIKARIVDLQKTRVQPASFFTAREGR